MSEHKDIDELDAGLSGFLDHGDPCCCISHEWMREARKAFAELRDRRVREAFVRNFYAQASDTAKQNANYSGFHMAMLLLLPSPPESEVAK